MTIAAERHRVRSESPVPPTADLRPLLTATGAVGCTATAVDLAWIVTSQPSEPMRWLWAVVVTAVAVQLVVGTWNTLLSVRRSGARVDPADDVHVVAVLVPLFNEDEHVLERVLSGLLDQTRLPDAIAVVDDGSTCGYESVKEDFLTAAGAVGVAATWDRTQNRGKRHAQARALAHVPEATVLVTVDSDSILDRRAVERGLRAFADPRVQSVAAVVLTENLHRNVLTRMVDIVCVGLQLFERSACSVFGAVLVNSGACAFYRAAVVRDNLAAYLSETILHRPVQFSDDSLLTLFALQRGRAVQQDDCFVFTVMPEGMGHHRRQQVRWFRGSFIRSLWRFRYLPLRRPAYWYHLAKWILYALVSSALVVVVTQAVEGNPSTLSTGVVSAIGLHLLSVVRYVLVRRSDTTPQQALVVFAHAPLAAVWAVAVLRSLRWYAMATFFRTGWGTRQQVEGSARRDRKEAPPSADTTGRTRLGT